MRFLVLSLAVVGVVLAADDTDVYSKLSAKADHFNEVAKPIVAGGSGINGPVIYHQELIFRRSRTSVMLPVQEPLKQWLDRFMSSNIERVSGEELTTLIDLYTSYEKAVFAGLKTVLDAVTGKSKVSASELRSAVASVLVNSEDVHLITFPLLFSVFTDIDAVKSEIRGEHHVATLPAMEGRNLFQSVWSCTGSSDMDGCLGMWKDTAEQMAEQIRSMADL